VEGSGGVEWGSGEGGVGSGEWEWSGVEWEWGSGVGSRSRLICLLTYIGLFNIKNKIKLIFSEGEGRGEWGGVEWSGGEGRGAVFQENSQREGKLSQKTNKNFFLFFIPKPYPGIVYFKKNFCSIISKEQKRFL
jgi:hypothetical protein